MTGDQEKYPPFPAEAEEFFGSDDWAPLPTWEASFVSGPNSGSGLNIQYYTNQTSVVATAVLGDRHQGPPGHSHGGCLLSILDEAMGIAAWIAGKMVLAARVELDFKSPVPLGRRIFAEAAVSGQDGRKVYTDGKISLADGTVACRSKGLFIEKKDFFSHNRFDRKSEESGRKPGPTG